MSYSTFEQFTQLQPDQLILHGSPHTGTIRVRDSENNSIRFTVPARKIRLVTFEARDQTLERHVIHCSLSDTEYSDIHRVLVTNFIALVSDHPTLMSECISSVRKPHRAEDYSVHCQTPASRFELLSQTFFKKSILYPKDSRFPATFKAHVSILRNGAPNLIVRDGRGDGQQVVVYPRRVSARPDELFSSMESLRDVLCNQTAEIHVEYRGAVCLSTSIGLIWKPLVSVSGITIKGGLPELGSLHLPTGLDQVRAEVLQQAYEQQQTLERLSTVMVNDQILCKVCMDEIMDTICLPCAHAVGCESCVAQLEICPICRRKIDFRQKFYV